MESPDNEGLRVADWQAVVARLPTGWRELAFEVGALRRNVPKVLGAKISDPEVLLRLILLRAGAGLSLLVAAAAASAGGLVSVSPVALHLRMKKPQTSDWLQTILELMFQQNSAYQPPAWGSYEVVLVDATSLSSPGAQGTSARVHYALRLSDARLLEVLAEGPEVGETLRNFAALARPGQLWIEDRGYCNVNGIFSLVDQGADVLVRLNRSSLPLYDEAGALVDPLAQARTLRAAGSRLTRETWIQQPLAGRGVRRCRGRLLVCKLPAEKAEQARQRLVSELGARHVTAAAREWAGYVALWTTAPAAQLPAGAAFSLYGGRWQVELRIKRDKSISGLADLPCHCPDTIRSWLLGKLLAMELARRLTGPGAPPHPAEPTRDPPARRGRASPSRGQQQAPRGAPASPADGGRPELWRTRILSWTLVVLAIVPLGAAQLHHALPDWQAHLQRYADSRPRQHELLQPIVTKLELPPVIRSSA